MCVCVTRCDYWFLCATKMEDTMVPRNVSGIVSVSGFVLLFGTLIVGGFLLVISYVISGLFRSRQLEDLPKGYKKPSVGLEELRPESEQNPGSSGAQGGKKVKNKKSREPQQKFKHNWLVGSLRGHTDNVLDLNFSTNGRFVGTCAEGWYSWLLSSTNWSRDTQSQIQEEPIVSTIQFHRPPTEENVRDRFKCSNLDISEYLAAYVLSPTQLVNIGYPVKGNRIDPCTYVNHTPYPNHMPPSYIQLKKSSFRANCTLLKEIECVRCSKLFKLIQFNIYMFEEECHYHSGKLKDISIVYETVYDANECSNETKIWSCCQKGVETLGCCVSKKHVWYGVTPGWNYFYNFICTRQPEVAPDDGFYGVYGLDCEMCYTQNGLEVVRIAVVNMNGDTVYSTYVKPKGEIIDYNTQFNGISANNLIDAKMLEEVHRDLACFIHEDTILIGHGLENDLRCLCLVHKRCIDSSILFPHPRELPFRNSLKYLAKRLLQRNIQEKQHDPSEDARAAVDLILIKCHKENFLKLYK